MDPRWLLKAGGITLACAALLAYASICAYVYVGAWRTLLRPVAAIAQTPREAYTAVKFDAAETGTPRLTGWWIPAASSDPGTFTVLFLHSGDGSLGTNAAELDQLHEADVNLFAFDYRGYGQSQGPHPTEQRMLEDTSAALDYLVNTRHLRAATILPFGSGLGAVLAANLVRTHAELPGVAIDNPWPNAADRVIHDPRYRFLPIGLLLDDRFDLEGALSDLDKPKLLISGGPGAAGSRHSIPSVKTDNYTHVPRLAAYFGTISDPKMIVTLTRASARPKGDAAASPVVGEDVERLATSLDNFLERDLHRPKTAAPVDHTDTVPSAGAGR